MSSSVFAWDAHSGAPPAPDGAGHSTTAVRQKRLSTLDLIAQERELLRRRHAENQAKQRTVKTLRAEQRHRRALRSYSRDKHVLSTAPPPAADTLPSLHDEILREEQAIDAIKARLLGDEERRTEALASARDYLERLRLDNASMRLELRSAQASLSPQRAAARQPSPPSPLDTAALGLPLSTAVATPPPTRSPRGGEGSPPPPPPLPAEALPPVGVAEAAAQLLSPRFLSRVSLGLPAGVAPPCDAAGSAAVCRALSASYAVTLGGDAFFSKSGVPSDTDKEHFKLLWPHAAACLSAIATRRQEGVGVAGGAAQAEEAEAQQREAEAARLRAEVGATVGVEAASRRAAEEAEAEGRACLQGQAQGGRSAALLCGAARGEAEARAAQEGEEGAARAAVLRDAAAGERAARRLQEEGERAAARAAEAGAMEEAARQREQEQEALCAAEIAARALVGVEGAEAHACLAGQQAEEALRIAAAADRLRERAAEAARCFAAAEQEEAAARLATAGEQQGEFEALARAAAERPPVLPLPPAETPPTPPPRSPAAVVAAVAPGVQEVHVTAPADGAAVFGECEVFRTRRPSPPRSAEGAVLHVEAPLLCTGPREVAVFDSAQREPITREAVQQQQQQQGCGVEPIVREDDGSSRAAKPASPPGTPQAAASAAEAAPGTPPQGERIPMPQVPPSPTPRTPTERPVSTNVPLSAACREELAALVSRAKASGASQVLAPFGSAEGDVDTVQKVADTAFEELRLPLLLVSCGADKIGIGCRGAGSVDAGLWLQTLSNHDDVCAWAVGQPSAATASAVAYQDLECSPQRTVASMSSKVLLLAESYIAPPGQPQPPARAGV